MTCANRSLLQKVGQIGRVSQAALRIGKATGRFEVEDFANRSLLQKVGQMSLVFQPTLGMGKTTGRFEVEDFAKHIRSLGVISLCTFGAQDQGP